MMYQRKNEQNEKVLQIKYALLPSNRLDFSLVVLRRQQLEISVIQDTETFVNMEC